MVRVILILFSLVMILIGIADLTQPESFMLAMDQISMPHYILSILGTAKICGGVIILVRTPKLLKEWAFAGFFIWALGGISAHLLSGHGIKETAPILGLTVFLGITYFLFSRKIQQD